MYDRLEIFYSRLRRSVSRNRWSARLMGHPEPAANADEPGLILIQINGLSERAFRRALDEHRMPFLSHLAKRDGYHIHPLYSGLPSTGAAFQAELFYGMKGALPGFRFLDPLSGEDLFAGHPQAAAAMEDQLKNAGDGLLRGGSVWAGVFSGGADESHVCASTAGFHRSVPRITLSRVARLLMWHGWNVLRVVGNLLALGTLAVADLLRRRTGWSDFIGDLRAGPIRLAVSAILREVVTTGAAVDAERGVPVIHLSYLGYDEYAHRRGPDSRFARWSLAGIDRAIRRVWMAAHRSPRRDYQIWMYSPHGQEEVADYAQAHGWTLDHAVNAIFHGTALPSEKQRERSPVARTTRARYRWLDLGEEPSPSPSAPADTSGNRRTRSPRVVAHGPLAFVHLPHDTTRDRVKDLAEELVAKAGIPAVMIAADGGRAKLHTPSGIQLLPEEAGAYLGADHPHPNLAGADLAALAHHPAAGELVLLGWRPHQPVSFSPENGGHGGAGPEETTGFILFPPEAPTFSTLPGSFRAATLRAFVQETLKRGAIRDRPHSPVSPHPRSPDELWSRKGIPLRIMTYNVHGCRGMDGVYAPHRIARVIARERPDVICLQELDQERTRSGGVDQIKVIAERLELDYHFHTVAEVDDGRFGNAILSTYPLERVKAVPLPGAERVKDVLQLEDRGALWVRLKVRGEVIDILNTHLSILQRERRLQTEMLLGPELLGSPACSGTVILAGDLNASPDSWTVQRIETHLRNAVSPGEDDRELRTWTGRTPLRRIDHMFISDAVVVRRVRVPRSRLSRTASDHLPMVVDLLCPVSVPHRNR